MPQRYTASGFPKLVIRDTASTLAFMGYYWDSVLGAYTTGRGRRCYNPALMRFITADDLSPFAEGGVNPYAYCQGDPVNYFDPEGTTKHKISGNPPTKTLSNKRPLAKPKKIEPHRQSAATSSFKMSDFMASDTFNEWLTSIIPHQERTVPKFPIPTDVSPELQRAANAYTLTAGNKELAPLAFNVFFPGLSPQERKNQINALKAEVASTIEASKSSSNAAPPMAKTVSDVRRT